MQYVEAEVVGSNIGDPVGRVYLDQKGTSVVRGVDNVKNYYILPERMAVVNPFFNGQRTFVADVYRNNRLRDRPLLNSRWELMLNQRDEAVNKDVNLDSLDDIKLYIYYTDFTAF